MWESDYCSIALVILKYFVKLKIVLQLYKAMGEVEQAAFPTKL